MLLKPTLLKKIKVFAASHDKSMTDVFNEAIELYLSKYPRINLHPETKKSRFTDVVLHELERYLPPMAARTVLYDVCREHNTDGGDLNPRTFTHEIISDICKRIPKVTGQIDLDISEKRFLCIVKEMK